MSVFAIVYGAKSGIVRQIIKADLAEELNAIPLAPGEAMVRLDPSVVTISLEDARRHTANLLGLKSIPETRHALVHPERGVVAYVNADPEIDKVEGHQLVVSPHPTHE